MVLFALLSLSLLFSFSTKNSTLTQAQCLPDQRDALIQLKQGFITTELHSWNASTDCCIWDGIECDKQNGVVTAVNLAHRSISGEINLALFNLSSLRYLNLYGNNFYNLTIPHIGFERLANLTHLDLSYCRFIGQVPSSITNITRLKYLNLGFNRLTGTIPMSLFNLSSLRYLNLSENNFHNLTIPQIGFERLVNLTHLDLSYCYFISQVPPSITNITRLKYLNLGFNWLTGTIPMSLFNLTSLRYLYLSGNNFYNLTIPQIGFERLVNLTHLDLSDSRFIGQVPPSITNITRLKYLNLGFNSLTGTIPMSLFNLISLRYLNLAGNNFYNLTIPQIGFERLANLTHLDLSDSGFIGQVPIGFSALTNLISLDLSYNYVLNLHGTGLKTLLSNLTKLQLLHLNGIDISINGSEWGKAVFQRGLTLQELSMASCGLRGNFPDFHLTNLTGLDLSDNSMLSGQLPDSIGNLQNLSMLDLRNCSLYGVIPPSITNITKLKYLNLGANRLTGTIPMSLFSHPSLQYLHLYDNQLSGYLPEFSNGSSTLAEIYIDYNNLQGLVPISLFKLPQLNDLELASNNFVGTLNLDAILYSVKDNKNLKCLELSNNKFSIIEGKNHNESFYTSFPQMYYIYLASLHLTKLPSFLRYQTNIEILDLSNNKIGGVIPNWLCSKTRIGLLDLSHNFFTKIEDDAHLTFSESFYDLDFSFNRISGPVPLLPPGIVLADFSSNYFSWPAYFLSTPIYLFLSKNSLTGEIPLSICNVPLPNPLDLLSPGVLDLSFNNLTGTIPPCLLEDAKIYEVLDLQSNNLSGPLPRNINQGCKLRTINLSGNRIHGSLPQSLLNCDTLQVLDLGNNQIVDRFPFWLGTLRKLRVLVLRSNQFYGPISNMEVKTKTNNSFFPRLKVFDVSSNHFSGIISKTFFENLKDMVSNSDSGTFGTFGSGYSHYYYPNSITVLWKGQEMEINKSLSIFSSLDLSENGFSGEIPEEIGQLKSLDVLNLSHNALIGPIPSELGNLHELQSLDLSCNQLSGHIPQELTSLTFLSALNLSYNNMVGEIPQGHQFSTFQNDSYLGNPGLCGSPLSMQCATTPSNDGFNKDLPSKSSTDIIELSISIGLGLGAGFVSVICALVSWENGREQFNFIVDRFYFQHIPWIVLHLRLAIGRE